MKEGKLKILKNFREEEESGYYLSKNGNVIARDKKLKVFALPDF